MTRNIQARLTQLERLYGARSETRKQAGEEAARAGLEWMRRLVRALGTEQLPHESLAMAVARAMGISMRELNDRLAREGDFLTSEELAALNGAIREGKNVAADDIFRGEMKGHRSRAGRLFGCGVTDANSYR